jgi:membrane fusion protein (multidrug efflux system)
MARGFTTRASYDAAKHALSAAIADRASASATATATRAELGTGGGVHPLVAAAIAMRDKAALDLKRTDIRAPEGGRVSQSDKLLAGNMAFTGLPSVSIVSDQDTWIEANFKETQLAKIRVGQPAEVTIDAIPGKHYRAHVTGIGAGTGSQFSLLPAQNATGNWVKVTQRVPVRLRLDEAPDRQLVAGWSANVTVDVTGK